MSVRESIGALETKINGIFKKHYTRITGDRDTIPSSIDISKYYTNGFFSDKSITKQGTVLIMEVIKKIGYDPLTFNRVYSMVWHINEEIFNMSYVELQPYIVSLDILDLLEVQSDPGLVKAMQNVKETLSVSDIEIAYKTLEDILSNKTSLKNNPVARAYRAKSINPKQLRQVLGPIGFKTEISSKIFSAPIPTSFTQGIEDVYGFSIESRAAAKALNFSKEAIARSETFAKHIQLITLPITSIIHGDCGSNKLVKFNVKGKDHPSMTATSRPDKLNMIGKWYKDHPTDDKFKIINEDSDIDDKTIYLRTAYNCSLDNPHHICSVCFGDIAFNIPLGFNLGHYCSIALMKLLSQSILSTKHLQTSAVASDAVLDDVSSLLFKVKGAEYYIDHDKLKTYDKVIMRITKEDGYGLRDIRTTQDLKKITVDRSSSVRNIGLEFHHKDGKIDKTSFKVGTSHRTGKITIKFFEYIINSGYIVDKKGNYFINLSKWKLKSSVMILPEVEFSFFTLFLEVSTMIKKRTIRKSGSVDTPETLTAKVFDLINSKLNLNIAHLEVITYALTAKDLIDGDYSMARNVEDPNLVSLATAIGCRGHSTSAAYGITSKKAIDPMSFVSDSKTDSPLDVLISPVESLANFDKVTLGDYSEIYPTRI